MIEHVKKILSAQFEASLCMMNDCLVKCPAENWDGKVAKYPFWHVAHPASHGADGRVPAADRSDD